MTVAQPPKRARTRARIAAQALDLFDRQGYEETTVAQIASAAGVTEMTVFRHFPTKERLVLDDPYDPVIAAAISAQPRALAPLARTARGLRRAWQDLPEPDGEQVRRRVRVVARSQSLRASAWRNNADTEQIIAEQLRGDGVGALPARVAASAALAALMTALYEWAEHDDIPLSDVVLAALTTLDSGDA
ncbi:DNA-binding transcriptional regulator, AcrR family [Asanoa hainanensis]|uniref:DNA-binding transcriptional regulator, AcrR family n=1 Tax=Asanoa hainanensis TaxID=560556 RepID=A0A239PEP8_9ACTN|nr:TetR/AcrR family transcriptional regulator [Asanoa hainanensis]SNT65510.1 DNA-binding transcriptional regulator, AcrR family [Asanoa hainanensis]